MKPFSKRYYTALLRELETRHIPYAILRDDLETDLYIKDLDLLIDPKKTTLFLLTAQELGFILINDGYLNPGKKVLVKYVDGVAYFLDVHEFVVYRGLEFLDYQRVLENRIKKNGFYYLSPEDHLISLLFHNVLSKKKIQLKHRATLRKLLSLQLDRSYLHRQLKKFGLSFLFHQLCENFDRACEDDGYVVSISNKARKNLVFRRPANLKRHLQIYSRRRLAKFVGKKRGIVIAFIGPDGTGKTTTIRAIKRGLKEIGLTANICYLGPWGCSLLKLRTYFSWLNPKPTRGDSKIRRGTEDRNSQPLSFFLQEFKFYLRSGVYYFTLVLEMWARWLYYVLPRLRQGNVVLADRYIYDILVGYKNRPMDYQETIRQKISLAYPEPDVGILLHSPADLIFQRKPQLSSTHIARLQVIYDELADQFGFVKLDTSKDVQTTYSQFKIEILPRLLAIYQKNLSQTL